MWMVLFVPILLTLVGFFVLIYVLLHVIAIAVNVISILFGIIFCLGLLYGLFVLYDKCFSCKTKDEKRFFFFCVTICLALMLMVFFSKTSFFSKQTAADISVLNESENEIITEINIVSVFSKDDGPKTIVGSHFVISKNDDTNKVFDSYIQGENYHTKGYTTIRDANKMTERCEKLGLNYSEDLKWKDLKKDEKILVGGLWNSDSYAFRLPQGTWIITLKTYDRDTKSFYSVIYTQDAFSSHSGESLKFSYSGEDISLIEHKKAKFIPETMDPETMDPETMDKQPEKEVLKKFEPNLIIINQEEDGVHQSGLCFENVSDFTTFPTIRRGKYEFYCLEPNRTYTAELYFSKWNGWNYEKTFSKEKKFTINNDCAVFYIDEKKQTVKQMKTPINYKKIKIDN